MPQNATKKGLKEENQKNFPELVYEQLELSKRIACYHYWCHLNSAGKEGWDPEKTPGSVFHWRTSKYLQDNIKKSSWPRIGKVRRAFDHNHDPWDVCDNRRLRVRLRHPRDRPRPCHRRARASAIRRPCSDLGVHIVVDHDPWDPHFTYYSLTYEYDSLLLPLSLTSI